LTFSIREHAPRYSDSSVHAGGSELNQSGTVGKKPRLSERETVKHGPVIVLMRDGVHLARPEVIPVTEVDYARPFNSQIKDEATSC
jgi:hypothetical protein